MPSSMLNLRSPIKNSDLEEALFSVAEELGLKAKVKYKYKLSDEGQVLLDRAISIKKGLVPMLRVSTGFQDPHKNYNDLFFVKAYLFKEKGQQYIEKAKSCLNSIILAEEIWANFCLGSDDGDAYL